MALGALLTFGTAQAQTNSMSTTGMTTTMTTGKAAPDSAQLTQYVGSYTVATGDIKEVIVTIERGKLVGEAVGLGQSSLIPNPNTPDAFTVPDPNGGSDVYATVQFGRDTTGKVMKVLLNVQGQMIEGTKTK